jgi:hypothetical protein
MDSEVVEALTGLFGVMVPIVALVLGIGLAFWSVYWNHQRRQLQFRERQLMIEKGMTPPPAMPEETKRSTPEDCLRRGIVQVFLGIGLTLGGVVLANFGDQEQLVWIAGVAAAIVGSIGVGNLVYYFIARRKPDEMPRTM